MGMLQGKRVLVAGIASRRSIAWGIAEAMHREGAQLAFTYQNERLRERVDEAAASFGSDLVLPCDVARDEVLRLAATPATRPEAVKIAVRHQLVTPVSGAVVLESQQQYDAAGLRPAAPHEVPTIPEPGTWAVIAVATLMLAVTWWRRRRESQWTAR